MPIYEFRCAACGAVGEKLRPLGDTGAGLTCDRCGADTLERIPSTFATAAGGPGGACGPSGFT